MECYGCENEGEMVVDGITPDYYWCGSPDCAAVILELLCVGAEEDEDTDS